MIFNKVNRHKLSGRCLGQRSRVQEQAHMVCGSCVSACFSRFVSSSSSHCWFSQSQHVWFSSSSRFLGAATDFQQRFVRVLPSHPPSFFLPLILSVLTGAWNGGSWLGCGDLPAMGAVFYLGAGWPQWKPLDIPGTHLPLKRGSGLHAK